MITIIDMMFTYSTVLIVASLGCLINQRVGLLNIGIEGLFTLAAFTTYYTLYITKNLILSILFSIVITITINLLFAFLVIELRLNHIVTGMAITFIGIGISYTLGSILIGKPLPISTIEYSIIIDGFKIRISHILTIILAICLWYIIFKTKFGYYIRAIGEDPYVADLMGIPIKRIRYITTIIEAILVSLSATYFIIYVMGYWTDGVTMGWGWLAIILAMFSLWNPIYVILGSYLIAGISLLRFVLPVIGIKQFSTHLTYAIPYIVTIIVLAIISRIEMIKKRLGIPKSLAKTYSREEKGGEYV